MKYIRTTDGIYDRKLAAVSVCDNKEVSVIRYDKYEIEPIIKQADTIEELCDVIVCNEKLFYPLTSNDVGNHFNWEEIIECSHNVCCSADYKGNVEDLYFKIYGAIWIDKGLIFVAKMNDKGELCLL